MAGFSFPEERDQSRVTPWVAHTSRRWVTVAGTPDRIPTVGEPFVRFSVCTLDVTPNGAQIRAVIRSFRDKRTQQFWDGKRVKAFDGIRRQAEMKLDQLDAAFVITDLNLPGNRLEALQGNRKGQHSIRINDQWRICFEWPMGSDGPTFVEIVDYH